MDIPQREIVTRYRVPTPGELNRRVTFRTRQDVPGTHGGTDPIYDEHFTVWAKVRPISGIAYRNSVQTGEVVTHAITIRLRPVNTDMEAVLDGRVYRVMRALDMNDERRFSYIEVKELGLDGIQDAVPDPSFGGGFGYGCE
ncbi:phage head closure protein [Dryocola sp. LX212]